MAFIDVKLIARQTLPRLIDNLVLPNLCYTDYSDTFADLGDTIQVRKPTILNAVDFSVGDTISAQSVSENSVDVKMDKIATVDVDLNAMESAHHMSPDAFARDFLEPAAAALAEKINKAGIEAFNATGNILGTIGTTPSSLADLAAARKFLNKAKAPMADRRAIWSVDADAKFTEIGNLVKVNESGSPRGLREGEIGRVFGVDNYFTQAIEARAVAATGTVLVDGAATKGATKIHVDGLDTAAKVGDMFTIASDTTIYTVVGVGALETADQDWDIMPALAANAADNAAITMKASTISSPVFHKNALAFVTRPLPIPGGVEAYTTNYGGYSLRVVRGYDIATKKEKLSMDVLYGYKLVYPELAARYMG